MNLTKSRTAFLCSFPLTPVNPIQWLEEETVRGVVCGGFGTSGYDTATRLLAFFFNSNLGLWPAQVKSDSVEPETQKQIEQKPLDVAKSHLSSVRGGK